MNLTKHGVDYDGAVALTASGLEDKVKYDYPLTADSVVLDIGGYDGTWTSELIRWHIIVPHIHIFEPVYYEQAEHAVHRHSKIKVYRYGLSDKDETCIFNVNHHETGRYLEQGSSVKEVKLFDIARFVPDKVDLMAINIEGGEFSVLPRLIETKLIERVKYLLVQFHAKVPDAIERRLQINEKLKETHNQIHDYPFVWDAWERKS